MRTKSIISRPRFGLISFFNDLGQHLFVEREVGDQLAQARVLFLQLFELANFRKMGISQATFFRWKKVYGVQMKSPIQWEGPTSG